MTDDPGYVRVARDLWRAQREGPPGIRRRQERRLASLVAHARARSPLYARLYAGLPSTDVELRDLPPTTKPELMAAFDDWLTDRTITREVLEAFIADPSLAGTPFRSQLFVCTTSGTTGHPGLFVHDQQAISVFRAMTIVRLDLVWLGAADWLRAARKGFRWAAVAGTGAHFGGTGWVEFERHRNPLLSRAYRVFSVQRPISDLVPALNAFDPAIVTTYPSALELLGDEQAAGRLHIRPTVLEMGGESTSLEARTRLAGIFGRPVHEVYACTEFLSMAVDCAEGWLHVSSDWVILEPVDADLRPTAPGTPSHTVLLTSLADRLQPIIRYDLGDSVLARPDPCPCGSPFPAIRVEGRRDDVLRFAGSAGRSVTVLPLAISAEMERVPGVRRSQLVQTGPMALEVRLDPEPSADAARVWQGVLAALRAYLDRQGLASVDLARASRLPEQNPTSGKFRQVIAAQAASAGERPAERDALPLPGGPAGAPSPPVAVGRS